MSNLYKVGDKVRVLKPSIQEQIDMHPGWVGEMNKYHRKITTISCAYDTHCQLKDCRYDYCYDWLEPIGKYKAGDKVTIRKPLELGQDCDDRYYVAWVPKMDRLDGQTVEITKDGYDWTYRLSSLSGDWLITPAWIVPGNIEEKAAIAAPKNNDGRSSCFWCGSSTKKSLGFNDYYDVCTGCGK